VGRENVKDNAKPILDACCGSRMFWFDKENPNAVFMDNREVEEVLCDGRKLVIKPDVLADFRDIPYPDNSFHLVVFDPPHLVRAGETSWIGKKYGVLNKTWAQDLKCGVDECFRVLKDHGVLVFKWNEDQIKLKDVLAAIERAPLFGDKRSKTHWLVFLKVNAKESAK
jgi:SAM-dependent methyltransferase